MSFLRTLSRRLSLSSIRSRILVIALLPALLAEFGMAAYFTTQTLATAEKRCARAPPMQPATWPMPCRMR